MSPPGTALTALTAGAGAIALGAAALGLWRWSARAARPPTLYFAAGELSSVVLPLCKALQQPYEPTPWAMNNHLQTILGLLRTASIHANYSRQLIVTGDGGTLGLDWFDGCDRKGFGPADTPIFLVLHGINGGSHEGYCKWACAAGIAKGWRAVVLNFRGCNGLPLTSPRGYFATLTNDLHRAVQSIQGRFPDAPLFAAGYSLGSVLLTKYIAEADAGLHGWDGSGLVAAAMVSNPVCLTTSGDNLMRPWSPNYMYNLAVVYKLKEYVRTHEASIRASSRVDMDLILDSWTIRAFEEESVVKGGGFTSRADYHAQANSLTHIPHIRTPSLFLVAADDPFLGVLPVDQCSCNPHTILAVTERGGHVAFLKGMWPFKLSWMDEVVVEFMQSVLDTRGSCTEAAAARAEHAARTAALMDLVPSGGALSLLADSEDERPAPLLQSKL